MSSGLHAVFYFVIMLPVMPGLSDARYRGGKRAGIETVYLITVIPVSHDVCLTAGV